MTDHDPVTGEILERAADGRALVPAANGLADFIRMLGGGQFDADVHSDLVDLAGDMQDQMLAQGNGKVKAKLTITVDISLEQVGNGVAFYLQPAHKIVKPVEKRRRDIAWTTEDNRFTPNMPRQGALFGTMRDVNASAPRARDVG